jgi:hypothetical protein
MSAKRMLADVLWEAANERLSPDFNEAENTDRYSCFAVSLAACGRLTQVREDLLHIVPGEVAAALRFLYSLGLDYRAYENGWNHFTPQHLQGVRYMWLLLAMHVAEDEGIEIECAA